VEEQASEVRILKGLIDDPSDQDFVTLTGRFILNMGAIEAVTRILIILLEMNHETPIARSDLPARIGYLRRRFPREPRERHQEAMQVFDVALKLSGFRNIVAHSPVASFVRGEKKQLLGFQNLTPNDPLKFAEYVGIDELRGRVIESARVGSKLLDMQPLFAQVGEGRVAVEANGDAAEGGT
jgi:hypothetical protein